MAVRKVALRDLVVNRANDRHGELENETAAIAWLFNERETHMRNLAKDIVAQGEIFEMPLVWPDGERFVVYDGNRRVTCMKLIEDPRKAPTTDLQAFFRDLQSAWPGPFPKDIQCQVETDRDRVDDILFRRHTGSQNGVGQSTWDDRMKATFVSRTGKGGGLNVADEIEKRLRDADLLPKVRKIPRSTLNRLLSAEGFRNRLGFTVSKGRFEYTHQEGAVLQALARVADDLATRRTVLNDVWDVDGKRGYLDELDREGVLPDVSHTVPRTGAASPVKATKVRPTVARPTARTTLIPQTDFGLTWPGRLQRHHQIWEELQFHLELGKHPNAISVLFRVLLELAVENYITQARVTVHENDKLAARVLKAGKDLRAKDRMTDKELGVLTKFGQGDKLVSADTLNRYVHSPSFAPSPEHLASMWDSLCGFIVLCLQA